MNHDFDITPYLNSTRTYSPEFILSLVDLTLLDENASPEALAQLKKDAEYGVAAVCVYPQHLFSFLNDCKLNYKRATVVNFPHGNEPINQVINSILEAKNLGADEIDYVFPYHQYLYVDKLAALRHCVMAIEMCKRNDLICKIIMETGSLPLDIIYPLASEIIALGCDFLKTSTGKVAEGATLPAVLRLLTALKDSNTNCGLKVSGGIKTIAAAQQFMNLTEVILQKPLSNDFFRIGASTLIDDLLRN